MAGTTSIQDLTLSKPDGSLLTRIEAEKELREKCKIFHNMGLLASYHLGLENRFALGMTPTSIIHWILDEMIRKKLIAGEQIGVQPDLESDASYFNAYTQRLGVFVQNGQALMPKEGEGIDMSDFQQNGAPPQGFTPPPPPPMGYGQQAPQQQQQYQQPQQQGGFGPPPGAPPQNFGPPPGGPPAFGPPTGAPGFGPPPGGPPMGPPPGFPQQAAPPQPQMPPQGMPPQQAAPPPPPAQAPSNRRRGKAAEAAPPAQAAPTQQTMPFPGGAPAQQPQGFGAPPAVPGYGPPVMGQPQAQQAAPQADTGALQAQINELKGIVNMQSQVLQQLLHIAKGIDAAVSITVRPYYEKLLPTQPSQLGTEATFKEIGLPYPS